MAHGLQRDVGRVPSRGATTYEAIDNMRKPTANRIFNCPSAPTRLDGATCPKANARVRTADLNESGFAARPDARKDDRSHAALGLFTSALRAGTVRGPVATARCACSALLSLAIISGALKARADQVKTNNNGNLIVTKTGGGVWTTSGTGDNGSSGIIVAAGRQQRL